MGERKTGATESQIEAAANRKMGPNVQWSEEQTKQYLRQAKEDSRFEGIWLVPPDQRIVDVADLRAICSVALDSREREASNSVVNELNRREGEMTVEEMDAVGEKSRTKWNERYPEFADAIKRVEAVCR